MTNQPIKMPVLSDTMQSGRLVSWQKQVGEAVKKGEAVAEVESDKAIMDLEAFSDGYLAGPLASPGEDIPVGSVIGYLADSPGSVAEPAPEQPKGSKAAETPKPVSPPAEGPESEPAQPPAPSTRQPAPVAQEADQSIKVSPYARGLARELGIDLAQLRPGNDGIIRSRQVLAAAMAGPQPDLDAGPACRYKLFTSMHRAVADNMIATLHTPMFRVNAELPTAPLHQAARDQGVSFSLLLARAAALTVREHPKFNMAYTPVGLAERDRVDVAIAVDVPGGLLTPVIHDAAGRPLAELQEEWQILRDKIARQRLAPADYQGATFYLSNMGIFPGVHSFDALVPVGAAAILAVGASREGRAIMTLTCDHRVVYGADAARFLATLEGKLLHPGDWLVDISRAK